MTSTTPTPVPPTPKKSDEDAALEKFGRIDGDGNVYVTDGAEERLIGGYPDGAPEDPLALYVRRFRDLEATVNLFEARLPSLGSGDIDSTLKTLREAVKEPNAIGDLPALRQRVEDLAARGEERKAEARKEREAAKQKALEARTEVVERAEKISGQDPARTQWKQSGQTLRELLEEWKELQRKGPRLDKATEDELWKRFSGARAVFDRHRRQFFSELDAKQSEAKAVKEQLIAEAEKLQNSTDWGPTSGEYRKLMDRWKAAPRASRKEDDALWARFRAAQQVFFDARRANDEVVGGEQKENLVKKQALADEAEKLLPVTDIDAAREKLRDIQDRWDEIGRVPNADFPKLEGRMRAVENAVKEKADEEWRRSNPETQARAAGMLGQLEQQIDDLKAQIAAESDAKKKKELEDALETKQSWLTSIQGSIQ